MSELNTTLASIQVLLNKAAENLKGHAMDYHHQHPPMLVADLNRMAIKIGDIIADSEPASTGVIRAAKAVIDADRSHELTNDHINALENSILIQSGKIKLPEVKGESCEKPPEGLICTRTPGHSGPCATLAESAEVKPLLKENEAYLMTQEKIQEIVLQECEIPAHILNPTQVYRIVRFCMRLQRLALSTYTKGQQNWRHIANEWADVACDSAVAIRNILDDVRGTSVYSTHSESLSVLRQSIARCRKLGNLHTGESKRVMLDEKDFSTWWDENIGVTLETMQLTPAVVREKVHAAWMAARSEEIEREDRSEFERMWESIYPDHPDGSAQFERDGIDCYVRREVRTGYAVFKVMQRINS